MFATHIQPDSGNAFGMNGGGDDEWFKAANKNQPEPTDFNFGFDKTSPPKSDFAFDTIAQPDDDEVIKPKASKNMPEEEEKVPEKAQKYHDDDFDDGQGLNIGDVNLGIKTDEYDSASAPQEVNDEKMNIKFASSPKKGGLSEIN